MGLEAAIVLLAVHQLLDIDGLGFADHGFGLTDERHLLRVKRRESERAFNHSERTSKWKKRKSVSEVLEEKSIQTEHYPANQSFPMPWPFYSWVVKKHRCALLEHLLEKSETTGGRHL